MQSDSMQRKAGSFRLSHDEQAGLVLAGLLSFVLVCLWALMYWRGGGSLDTVRMIDRLMIRMAAVLFCFSFAASALVSLSPSVVTHWILRNRRNLTITFVAAFALHLCAIARFYVLDASLFMEVSPPLTIALRVVGVFFVLLMMLVGPEGGVQPWRVLNAIGGYYIWAGLLNGFAKRVQLDSFYWLPVVLLILALALKIAGGVRLMKAGRAQVSVD